MKPGQIFSRWEQVRVDLLATVDKFNDDELTYLPFEGSWPVGQIILHIAECEDFWLHALVRQEIQQSVSYGLADYPGKPAIKTVLEAAHRRTKRFLDGLDEASLQQTYQIPGGETFTLDWIIWHVLEHEVHHRGELSLILGMLGREGLDV